MKTTNAMNKNIRCVDCPQFFDYINIMHNGLRYGICSKSKFKNLVRYEGSSCIVADDGTTL